MTTKREIIRVVLDGHKPAYDPWSYRFIHQDWVKIEPDFAPAHEVAGEIALENLLAFIEGIQSQPGCLRS